MLVVWCFNGFAQSFLWPPLISFCGWRTVFFFSAICGIIMILVWNRYCEDAPVISIENASIQGSSQKNSFLSPLLLCIMLTIVLQGMLRDGSPPGCPLIFPKPTILATQLQFSQVSCFLFSVSSASRPLPLCISGSFPTPFPVRESSSSPGPCPLWHFFVPPEKMPLFRFSFPPFSLAVCTAST